MNSIKLPVHFYAQSDVEQLWSVRDDNNVRIGRDLTEPQAQKIALALNLHDELVSALLRLRDEAGHEELETIDEILRKGTP